MCDFTMKYALTGKVEECLTVDPSDADGLKDGHKQQTHPAGGVRVEQLEHIHSTLTEER